MTKDELLRKRVIVENLWPGCHYNVGDILIKDKVHYWVTGSTGWEEKITAGHVEQYPYLMRPLQWWENREEKDMPKYVINTGTGEIHNVESSVYSVGIVTTRGIKLVYRDILPSTETEYKEYLINKDK